MTEQRPDWLTVDGARWALIDGLDVMGAFDGAAAPPTMAPDTSCYRGYVAYWALRDGKLFLADLEWYGEAGTIGPDRLFPGRAMPILASWIDGEVSLQGEAPTLDPFAPPIAPAPLWRLLAVRAGMVVEDRLASPYRGDDRLVIGAEAAALPAAIRQGYIEWRHVWARFATWRDGMLRLREIAATPPVSPPQAPPVIQPARAARRPFYNWLVIDGVTWRSDDGARRLAGAFAPGTLPHGRPEMAVPDYRGHEAHWEFRGEQLWLVKLLWHSGIDILAHAAVPNALPLPRPADWLDGELAFTRLDIAPGDGDAMIERHVTVRRLLALRAGRLIDDRQFIAWQPPARLQPLPATTTGHDFNNPFA